LGRSHRGHIGLLLGLRLQVPALLAASAVTAPLAIAYAVAARLSWLTGAGVIFASLAALQAGYVVGLLLAYGWSRLNLTAPARRHVAKLLAGLPGRRRTPGASGQ